MQEGGYTELRQGRFISVVVVFLIGCTVLLLGVGCAGTSSETSNKKMEQGSSPRATESEEEARCEGTRSYHIYTVFYRNGGSVDRSGSEKEVKKADKKAGQSAETWDVLTTNDLPGCPKGGLFLGTDKPDELRGRYGDDEVRGFGARDLLEAGPGRDVLYVDDGDDYLGPAWRLEDDGEDVLYGGKVAINSTPRMGSGTSSIAVKVGTSTPLIRTTTWTAVARRRPASEEVLDSLRHR